MQSAPTNAPKQEPPKKKSLKELWAEHLAKKMKRLRVTPRGDRNPERSYRRELYERKKALKAQRRKAKRAAAAAHMARGL